VNRRQIVKDIVLSAGVLALEPIKLLAQQTYLYTRQVALYSGDGRVYYQDGRKCWDLQKPGSGSYYNNFTLYKKQADVLQYGDLIQLSVLDRIDQSQRWFWCSQQGLAPLQAAKYVQQVSEITDQQTKFTIWSPDGTSGELKTGSEFVITDFYGTYLTYEAKFGNLFGPFFNADGNKANAARFNLVFLPTKG